jgi:acetyltransferase-like isoleucine patch superfamily enzyme
MAQGGRWLRCAYLTVRHVDEWDTFPAIRLQGPVRLRIHKRSTAVWTIQGRLTLHPWFEGRGAVVISLGPHSRLEMGGDLDLGDDVRFRVHNHGVLRLGGKGPHGFAGITSRCTILARQSVELGKDVVLSWHTFVTDSDWHPMAGAMGVEPVRIDDHVLVSPGSSVLKGAHVGRDSVVAGQSVVLRGQYPPRSLLAGNPAKPVPAKRDVWAWSYF